MTQLLSTHQSLFKSNFYLSNYQSNFDDPSNSDINKITTSFKMANPLIAMIGISDYDNDVFPNLECVVNDYKNVQHAFYVVRGYSFVFFNKQNQLIHKKCLNSKNKNGKVISRNDLKLRWTDNEILNYNDQVHLILSSKYNYDGLIYFISCHGDTGGVIYDSSGNKLPLIIIFDKFNNQRCIQLRNKPKIYFVEACRGNQRTKRFVNSLYDIDSSNDDNKNNCNINENDKDIPKVTQMTSLKVNTNKPSCSSVHIAPSVTTTVRTPSPPACTPSIGNLTTIDEYNVDGKDEFRDDIVEMKNQNSNNTNKNNDHSNVLFSKYNYNREIYANTEGYAVVEPGKNGAYMTRSITQAIENNDIFQKDFDSIINHTRKIMLKLMGTSPECAAQVIQDNNNIPKKVFF